jgi:hypothetical protein
VELEKQYSSRGHFYNRPEDNRLSEEADRLTNKINILIALNISNLLLQIYLHFH